VWWWSQQSISWQENGLKLWADKTQLASLARKWKHQQTSTPSEWGSDNEGNDGVDFDHLEQSTLVSSALPSTAASTPQAESTQRRSRRKARKSASPDLPADFHWFVNVYEAQSKGNTTINGVNELKVEVGELKAEIGDLKKDISSILSFLKEGM